MQTVQDHEDEIDRTIAQKIQDHNIHKNAKDLMEQLKPIAVAIDKCQSDTTSIADACHEWFMRLENGPLASHIEKVKKRCQQAITPEHLLAYALHPKCLGAKLRDDDFIIVHDTLSNIDDGLMATFIALQARDEPFPKSFFTDAAVTMNPKVWWKGLRRYNVPTKVVDLAIKMMSSPASSASIERVFSNFGIICNKIRNRLGNEKASKLVYCYHMLRQEKELDY